MPPRMHSFYYLIADGDKKRNNWPFQTRDVLAGKQIEHAFRDRGYAIADDLLNFPPPPGEQPNELAHVDTSACRCGDVIGTYTRLPRNDRIEGTRKQVPRGFTDLEQEIMDEWLPFVPQVSRRIAQLHERLHPLLPQGYEDRGRMQLYEAPCAPYNELSRGDGSPPRPYQGEDLRTPVFLLRLEKLQKRDAGYLGIWGFSGNITLVLAYLLRHRHADLLHEPHFVMGELVGGQIPERPFDLRYALEWRLEVLIDEKLPRAGRPRRVRAA